MYKNWLQECMSACCTDFIPQGVNNDNVNLNSGVSNLCQKVINILILDESLIMCTQT